MNPVNPSRRRVLQLMGLAGFGALAGRTAWLQVVEGPDLATKAKAEGEAAPKKPRAPRKKKTEAEAPAAEDKAE